MGPWPGAEIGQDFSSGCQLCPSSGKGEGSLRERIRGTSLGLLTFEQGADVPDVDAAGLHELAQRDLQEENGDSSNQGDQDIRDKKYTWGRKHRVGNCTGQPLSPWLASVAFRSPGRSGWSQLRAPPWPHQKFPLGESVQGWPLTQRCKVNRLVGRRGLECREGCGSLWALTALFLGLGGP